MALMRAGIGLTCLAIATVASDNSTEQSVDNVGRGSMQSATHRLFNTLLSTFIAVFLGFSARRMQFVRPEKGEMKGLGFFIGQVAFPLLVFQTVATSRLQEVDVGVIAACTLGKAMVMALTWIFSYFAYKSDRGKGQRVLTASVFAFVVVASNDFAIGFPVIDALYGSKMINMGVYITANALVGSIFFVPLTMVLFAVGLNIQKQGEAQKDVTWKDQLLQPFFIARDILLNPVITMTVLGLFYKIALHGTLEEVDGHLMFPSPLRDIITLVTSPFGMSALFLTGASLQAPTVSFWPVLLVLMKVVVCAFATYMLAGIFVGAPAEAMRVLHNFSFLYGMLPMGSAPLLFAAQLDPSAVEPVATAILLSFVLAGPVLFGTALFLEAADLDMTRLLGIVQLTCNVTSLACGVALLTILAVLRQEWGYACPGKFLVAAYGLTVFAYEALMVHMNPRINEHSCVAYDRNPWDPGGVAVCWLQNAGRFMVLVMQLVLLAEQHGATQKSLYCGTTTAAVCLLLALVPALVVTPNTVSEVCAVVELRPTVRRNLVGNSVFTLLLLLSFVGSVLAEMLQSRRMRRRAAEGASSVILAAGPRQSESEVEAEAQAQAPAAPRGGPGASRAGSSLGSGSEGSSSGSASAAPSAQRPSTEGGSAPWMCRPPRSVMRSLVMLQVLVFFLHSVNTLEIIQKRTVMGSFAQMLVLEGVLEHGQLVLLLVVIISDLRFCAHCWQVLPKLLPWVLARRRCEEPCGEHNPTVQAGEELEEQEEEAVLAALRASSFVVDGPVDADPSRRASRRTHAASFTDTVSDAEELEKQAEELVVPDAVFSSLGSALARSFSIPTKGHRNADGTGHNFTWRSSSGTRGL